MNCRETMPRSAARRLHCGARALQPLIEASFALGGEIAASPGEDHPAIRRKGVPGAHRPCNRSACDCRWGSGPVQYSRWPKRYRFMTFRCRGASAKLRSGSSTWPHFHNSAIQVRPLRRFPESRSDARIWWTLPRPRATMSSTSSAPPDRQTAEQPRSQLLFAWLRAVMPRHGCKRCRA